MQIWVDADACPAVIKEMLYRAADRENIPVVLVANRPLRTPPSRWIRSVQVGHGFDVADDHIASTMAVTMLTRIVNSTQYQNSLGTARPAKLK